LTTVIIFGGSYERDIEKNNHHQSGFGTGNFPSLFIRFPPSLLEQTLGDSNFNSDSRFYDWPGNQEGRD